MNAAALAPVRDDAIALEVREGLPASEWDAYVASRPDASAYHRAAWPQVIGRAFGHEVRMLAVRQDAAITGVLPLVVMRSRLFGTHAISIPFLNAGGVLANDERSATALVQSAIEIAKGAHARYLELRHTRRQFPSLGERRHRVAMTLALKESADSQWTALDRKVRNQVRKGEKSHLTSITGGAELVPAFYQVFAHNMRDLGTPVFSRRLFEEVLRTFPDSSRIVCVFRGEQPIAAGLVHWRGAWMEVPWASALREHNATSSNVFLYWQMIQLAIANGCRQFEFGRCAPDEGTFQFKKQWGAEPSPLVWEYWTRGGSIEFDLTPQSGKYGRAAAMWRRLPVPVATALGPRIVRGIPC
jgi:FemAB-related protein (PEP-CTERM system-associated)